MSHNNENVVPTARPSVLTMGLIATFLGIVVYSCTILGLAVSGGSKWGTQEARIAALESQKVSQDGVNMRQIEANNAMAAGFQALALELRETRTILNERTYRQEAENRAGIARNTAAIAAAARLPEKKPKSLATLIGIK